MTEYLVIDTEGTGLFDYKRPADADGQPRMASLSMIAVNSDLEVTEEHHLFIKPDGWSMPQGMTTDASGKAVKSAGMVNGLTDEFLTANGLPVGDVLGKLQTLMKGRTIVAHNIQHDLKHVRGELRRAGLPDNFEETPNICTMRGLTDVCKIPPNGRRGGYKWPSLSEACVFFHFDQFGDHSAKNDAHACLALAREMRKLGLLGEGRVHFAKNPPAKQGDDLRKALADSVAGTRADSLREADGTFQPNLRGPSDPDDF